MASLDKANADRFRNLLLDTVVRCSERCLYQSAKWAAELANSLPNPESSHASFETETDSRMEDSEPPSAPTSIFTSSLDVDEARLEAQEISKYLLAKSFFECREFDRCAAVFLPPDTSRNTSSPQQSATSKIPGSGLGNVKGKTTARSKQGQAASMYDLPSLSQKSLFLALYAKYMSGEKRRTEDGEMVLGPQDGGSSTNKELVGLSRILQAWFADRTAKGLDAGNQGWLEYLYGIVLARGGTEDDARQQFLKSIHKVPFNWGAWLELADLIENVDELQRAMQDLPRHVMTFVFNLYENQKLHQSTAETHQAAYELEQIFPGSEFLKTQRALLHSHAKEYEEADAIFSELLASSPYRLESLDEYSNILFVMTNRPKLAFLAQLVTATDKFRPETCCVVGNYYSLKSEHEKAVVYFRRALTLDRNFTSAWTLMGHEYVEMKNTHSAIESYRRAVDINRKDYRAWSGLGQTYELLEMHFYALFYFKRAASIKPSDPRMWQAMGACYDKIENPVQAIKAYMRALALGPQYDAVTSSFGSGSGENQASGILDPEILFQIACMYEKLENNDEAASYMELTVAQEEGPGVDEDDIRQAGSARPGGTGVTATTSKARMWLARWELSRDNLSRARELANELCDDGTEVEEAKALIRDVRARTEASPDYRYSG